MLQRFTRQSGIIFYLDTLNRVGVFFSDDFSFPLRRLLKAHLRWFMSQTKKKDKKQKVGRTAAETEKPSQPVFHCGVFRDGRDYGRITLRNMDAPNQIKEEAIKARVKATVVSSFIGLPAPALPEEECCFRLNCFHVSPTLPSSGTDMSMNTGQEE